MKFTPEGGKIAIRMIAGDSRATVTVTDTGPGIPDDQQAKIFEAFSQLGPGRRGVGLGLGLAITKRIIDAHGGRVGVESRPGEGSTFFFSLPIERR
jgi:signal transduction histidine kinase